MIKNYLQTQSLLQEEARKENRAVEKLARDYFGKGGITNDKIMNFMVEASQNEQWSDNFNSALKLQAEQKIRKFDEDELKAQFSIVAPELSANEVDERIKTFATTGSDTTGSNVAIDPILPTNILNVDEYLFANDGGILSDVTIVKEGGETQMPEFDVAPVPSRTTEAGTTPLTNFARRDALDYNLNPNIKIQIMTEVNDLAILKGSAVYFATLREAMVRELENEMVKQIFRGTDGPQQFHGILQTVTPATATNRRGSFNVTADTNINAETNRLRKLVLMLGTLPSNITNPRDVADYGWYMNRNTYYQGVLASLDGESRYYMEQILTGNPNLVGPHGLPVKLVSRGALADGEVVLAPMKKYYLALPEGIRLMDDGGIVNFNAGSTLVKAFAFADGGYVRNFMRSTSYTSGNDDNRDRNAWRFITGII